MARILVVDDESSIRITLREFLIDEGYDVEIAENAELAKDALVKKEYDLVLADIIMPRITGVNLLKAIKETSPRIQVIMMTGEPTVETASEAVREGAFDYLTKPINKVHLLKIVANALKVKFIDDERCRLEEENHRYQENLEQLVEERTAELKKEIAEHKLAEKALKEIEERFRLTTQAGKTGVWDWNLETDKIHLDPFLKEMLGYKDNEIKNHMDEWSKYIYTEDVEKVKSAIKIAIEDSDQELNIEHRMVHKNGSLLWLLAFGSVIRDESGKAIRMVGTDTDITKRKETEDENNRLEIQLRRAQKLETIGTLAGGIAHDFNNILTPILGYTDMAVAELPKSEKLKQNLSRVLEGAHRAKDLIEQILLFSKQIEKERHPLSLHLILKEALILLRSSIPTTIDIVQRIDSQCKKVLADATQIHQVIINLCTNAWHSMEEKGGTLTIELKQVTVNSAIAKLHPNLNEAEYACLTVQDTGHGMEEYTLDRLFEPFFTTKAVDKGTGLGLSVVHGIIQNHKGDIIVNSEQGLGTIFNIYLPILETESGTIDNKPNKVKSGNETILVVDDDKIIGNMLKQMLEKIGYKVDLYNKSKDVIEVFKENSRKYDLLISDLTMPEFSGIELSEVVQIVKQDFPIIIMTGYGDKLVGIDQGSHGIRKVLQKPIIMNDLAAAIREVLDK